MNIPKLIIRGAPTTGNYRISLVAWQNINASGGKSSTFTYTVNVVAAAAIGPTFTSQPVSQTVTAGTPVTFFTGATLTVDAIPVTAPGPSLTAQPQSQYVAPGTAVTFAGTATGTGLSYQWKKDGSALVEIYDLDP